MTQGNTLSQLSYRVVDNNTGAEVIPDLFHLHQSTWNDRAMAQGIPGSATLGDFRILLPNVRSNEWWDNRKWFSQLAKGQRVEGFLSEKPTGTPRFTGIITQPPHRKLNGAVELIGADSLWQLQQTQLYPGEILGQGGSALTEAQTMLGVSKLLWDDDFAAWNGGVLDPPSHLNYTVTGSFTFVTADPVFKGPALRANSSPSIASGALSWAANAQFNWPTLSIFATASQLTVQGVMVAGTDTTLAATAEVLWLTDATWTNGYMARALMRQTGVGSGLYNVDLEIWTTTGGVATRQALSTNVLTNLASNTLPFDVRVVLYNKGTHHFARVMVNGNDPGCVYDFTTVPSPSSGFVGIRAGWNAGGSPATYFTKIRFESRTGPTWGAYRFQFGNQSSGTFLLQDIISSGQTHLDMLLLSATLDGFWIRKVPGYGYESDKVDYAASPGTDYSQSVVLREGGNVVDAEVGPVSDLYATATRVRAIRGVDSGGSVVFSPRGNLGDVVLLDDVVDMGTPGAALQMGYARTVGTRKSQLIDQATSITVNRTPEMDKLRVLDYVLADIPPLEIHRQTLQIVGIQFVENSARQTFLFTQFPLRALVQNQLQRITRPIEFLASQL